MSKKFKLLTIISAAIALIIGGCGALIVLKVIPGLSLSKQAPEKPPFIGYADLNNIIVNVPDVAGDSPSDYVQVDIQFSAHDQKLIDKFSSVEPIMRSSVLQEIMKSNASQLDDQSYREDLKKNCLNIVNNEMKTALGANFKGQQLFYGAYITALTIEDDG